MHCSTSRGGKESRYRRICSRMTSKYCSAFRSAPPTRSVIVTLITAVIASSVTVTAPPISESPVTAASSAGAPLSFTNNLSATTSSRHQAQTATSSSHQQQQISESSAASQPTVEMPTMSTQFGQLLSAPPVYAWSQATALQEFAFPAASSFYDSPAKATHAVESAETQSANLMPYSLPSNESQATVSPATDQSQATATLAVESSSSPSSESLTTASPATDQSQATATRSFVSPATLSFFAKSPECGHPNGEVLRPSALWQFVDLSVTAANTSCRVTIESLRGNFGGGSRRDTAAGVALNDGTSYSTAAKANRTMSERQSSRTPQSLLVLRLVSGHPASECSMGTCSRPRAVQERQQQPTQSTSSPNGELRCSVALSFASLTPPAAAGGQPYPTGDGASRSSVASTLLLGDGSSSDALSTIAWTDASLDAIVNISGCCGIRLLLGYKIARARNACIVRSRPPPPPPSTSKPDDASMSLSSSSSAYYSSSLVYSSSSSESASFSPRAGAQHPSLLSSSLPSLLPQPPSESFSSTDSNSLSRSSPVPLTDVSSASTAAAGSPTHLAFKGELLTKYTYVFAQDQKLAWDGVGSDEGEAAAACSDTLDYELQLNPIPAANAEAALDVRIDLLAAPGNRSCRRLCIDDDCSPPLGAFNASGGQALSVRYQRHHLEPEPADGGDVYGSSCDESEYSGFTLRLLAPSSVSFSAVAASPVVDYASAEPSFQTISAAAAGVFSLGTAAAIAIASLAARRRQLRRRRMRRENRAEQPKQRQQRRSLPRQPSDNEETAVYSEPVDFEALKLRSSTVVEDSENYAEITTEENVQASRPAVGHAYYKLKRAAEVAAAAAAAAGSTEQTETALEQFLEDEREHVYCELLS